MGSGRGSEEAQGFRGQSIACTSNLICSFHHHARRPRGECWNRRKGPRQHVQQRPPSVYYFFIIIIRYTHIKLPIRFTYSAYFFVYFHFIASSSEPRDPPIDTATANPPAFVSRMSIFPLMGSALCVYEQGKASSRVVKSVFLILILLHVTLFPLISMAQQWSSRVSKSYPAPSSIVSP